MVDIFSHDEMCELLKNKTVVFLGDSNIRALYKDFLCLLTNNQFISKKVLKNKMENSCYGDKLVFHSLKSNGRDYREERAAKLKQASVSFFFLTRVYDIYVERLLEEMSHENPDVIVINSCVWDVTRWGPLGVQEYKKNLRKLMEELKKLTPNALVIWVTTPPIAQEMRGGFLLQELQFLKYSLRFHVVEANHFARKVVVENGFDVLDSHYHLKLQIQRRSSDGIHWFPDTVRFITNLLLTHISLAWDRPLPHRYQSEVLEENMESAMNEEVPIIKHVKVPIKYEETSSTSQETTQTSGKENLDSPKQHKGNKNKSNRWTKNHERQTHHAYLSRQDYNDRVKKIKRSKRGAHASPGKWTYGSSFSTNPNLNSNRQSYDSGLNRSFECSPPSSNHYDSGYFSPNQPTYGYNRNSRYLPHTNSNFENYPSQTPSYPYRHQPQRLVVYDETLMQPYQFPSVPPNCRLQPNINFAVDNPDGYYF